MAVTLSDQRTIGASSARSAGAEPAVADPAWRRYATSSIALSTLALGTARRASRPQTRCSVRTENDTAPARAVGVGARRSHVRLPAGRRLGGVRGRREREGKGGERKATATTHP